VSDFGRNPDIIMVWPESRQVPNLTPVTGYSVRALPRALDSWWIDVHRRAVPVFGISDLVRWLERYRTLSLTEGILVATDDFTREPVATAGSIANSKDGMFPDGGQLAWVATVPEHRGRGLASWLCALATARLQRDGFEKIFLCTGDDLTAAIHVYLRLGYLPCLYASDQRDRWARICEVVDSPFEPDRWPTIEEYLSG
jgi:ribosomal protein S18 acetylase RimI-like enzyme